MNFWEALSHSRFSTGSWIYILQESKCRGGNQENAVRNISMEQRGPRRAEQIQSCWTFQGNPWGLSFSHPSHVGRKELIHIVSAWGIIHGGSFDRVIFLFRSIFSLCVIGWWTEKWSQPLMILKAPSLNNLCWFRDNSIRDITHLAHCPFTHSEDFHFPTPIFIDTYKTLIMI